MLADRRATKGSRQLREADTLLGQARRALARHDYRPALIYAERAYGKAVEAAGVSIEPVTALMAARATAGRGNTRVTGPHEFIDTPQPGGPRSQP